MAKLPDWVVVLVFLSVFVLFSALARADEGFATYYTQASTKAEGNSGEFTASGERYLESELMCARPNRRDMGKTFIVTELENYKTVVVRCNDVGPGKGPRKKGVVIDLSPYAFQVLAPLAQGKVRVAVQEVIE